MTATYVPAHAWLLIRRCLEVVSFYYEYVTNIAMLDIDKLDIVHITEMTSVTNTVLFYFFLFTLCKDVSTDKPGLLFDIICPSKFKFCIYSPVKKTSHKI